MLLNTPRGAERFRTASPDPNQSPIVHFHWPVLDVLENDRAQHFGHDLSLRAQASNVLPMMSRLRRHRQQQRSAMHVSRV
jgi:hypothetical protein